MFLLFCFLHFVLSLEHPAHAQEEGQIATFRFTRITRSERVELLVRQDSAILVVEHHSPDSATVVTVAMRPEDWARLHDSLRGVRLTEIQNLKSPSMNRIFDGAAHGSLLITTRDGSTFAHGFDDANPHPRLEPLVRELLQIKSVIE